MVLVRGAVSLLLLVLAVVLQVTVLDGVAYDGVVPDLVLLVVVAGALARGPELGALLGFAGGLVLDLVPPADHAAGRWALALVLVGYLAGRARQGAHGSTLATLATVAAASFVGTSVYALSGMLLRDPAVDVSQTLTVVGLSVLLDLVLAPFVMPPLVALFRRLAPHRVAY